MLLWKSAQSCQFWGLCRYTTMAIRALNLQNTHSMTSAANNAIWGRTNVWPLRIYHQATLCYSKITVLFFTCFEIQFLSIFLMLTTPSSCSIAKFEGFGITNCFNQWLWWITWQTALICDAVIWPARYLNHSLKWLCDLVVSSIFSTISLLTSRETHSHSANNSR